MSAPDLSGYVEVKDRVVEFYGLHPEGRIRATPPEVVVVGDRTFIAVTASVYRTPDDPTPCTGTAWEPFPGKTPYTRDSEAMNAETSAWGRALAAAGIKAHAGMASRDEIRNRRDSEEPAKRARKKAARPPGGPSEAQTKHVMALFGELGYGDDRDARLLATSSIVGRDVGSWNDVTADEADQVIDALRTKRQEATDG